MSLGQFRRDVVRQILISTGFHSDPGRPGNTPCVEVSDTQLLGAHCKGAGGFIIR